MRSNSIKIIKVKLINNPLNISFKNLNSTINDEVHIAIHVTNELNIDSEKHNITLTYAVLNEIGPNRFSTKSWTGYHFDNLVSLTNNALFLDLPGIEGNNIGSYLFNCLIEIMKDLHPEAELKNIQLHKNQAIGNNKDRRNQFYAKFGIKFNFTDKNKESGVSENVIINELNTFSNFDNIKTIELRNYLYELYKAEDLAIEQYEYYNDQYKDLYREISMYCNSHLKLLSLSMYNVGEISPTAFIAHNSAEFKDEYLRKKIAPKNISNLLMLTKQIFDNINIKNNNSNNLKNQIVERVKNLNNIKQNPIKNMLKNMLGIGIYSNRTL